MHDDQDFKDSIYLLVEWNASGRLISTMVMPGNPGIYL
jgi:hypothetical protein